MEMLLALEVREELFSYPVLWHAHVSVAALQVL